jgi:hypothetical protein
VDHDVTPPGWYADPQDRLEKERTHYTNVVAALVAQGASTGAATAEAHEGGGD